MFDLGGFDAFSDGGPGAGVKGRADGLGLIEVILPETFFK